MTAPQPQGHGDAIAASAGGVTAAAGTYALSLAAAQRLAQVRIRAQLLGDVVRLWPLLDANRLGETFTPWLTAMRSLIGDARHRSSEAAIDFYTAARMSAIHEAPPPAVVKLAAPLADEHVARALGYAGPGILTSKSGGTPEAKAKTALTVVMGTSSRLALNGGRQTVSDAVHEDPKAVGWFFKTDNAPCYLCALIASRGVVFKRSSFALSDAKFIGNGTAKVHNHCGCSLAPAFSHSQELPETNYIAAKVYYNRDRGAGKGTKNPALNAFRKAWDDHLAPTAPAFPLAQPIAA